MGRWSQYRHRGRGQADAPAFPLAPPDSLDFEVTSAGTRISVTSVRGCPEGADGWRAEERVSPAGSWGDPVPGDCGDTADVLNPCTLLTDYEVRIAWTLADVQVSDWAGPFTITCSV